MKFAGVLIAAATASMVHAQLYYGTGAAFLETPACNAGYSAPEKKGDAVDEAWNWIDNAYD
jgi:hypothetical protein